LKKIKQRTLCAKCQTRSGGNRAPEKADAEEKIKGLEESLRALA
jgi:hypothetical protein